MKLSELNPTPLYDVTIPSTGKRASFRPFFVKEERALLAAYESENANVMLNTVVQVVENCIKPAQTSLTPFDIEYLFLQIRAKSVGEYSALLFTCGECGQQTPQNIDIRMAEVDNLGNRNLTIQLSDTISIKMRYPTVSDLIDIQEQSDPDTALQRTISACMDTVFSGQEALCVREEPVQDIINFIDTLTAKQFAVLESFVETIPTVRIDVEWECKHCRAKNDQTLRGLQNFF